MNRGFYPSDEYVLVDLKNVLTARRNPWSIFLSREAEIDPHPSEKGHKNRSDGYKAMER